MPRICILLNKYGIKCSKTKVYRYMKEMNLFSVIRVKKMHRKPKEIKNTRTGFKNVIQRKWALYDVNELWVTDVTFIKLKNSFVYLSVLKDAKSGFIVGHKLSKVNDNKIWKDTLENANQFRQINKKLVIHSDNGNQYTSIWMRRYAKKNNIIISLSRAGNSIDNAICETFFSQLKHELPNLEKQQTFNELENIINNYINYHNYERIMIKHKDTPASFYLGK